MTRNPSSWPRANGYQAMFAEVSERLEASHPNKNNCAGNSNENIAPIIPVRWGWFATTLVSV